MTKSQDPASRRSTDGANQPEQTASNVPAILATPPASGIQERPKRPPSRLTLILSGALLVIVAFGGGFFVGRGTAPEASAGAPGGFADRDPSGSDSAEGLPSPGAGWASPGPGMGQFSPDGESGFPSGGVGRGSISGTIVEQGDSQLIVELDDGSEVAVNLTEETTVSQLTDLESTELAVGDSISVVPSGLQAASASAEVDALEIQRR